MWGDVGPDLAYSKTSAFLGTTVMSHHISIQNINFIIVDLMIKILIYKLKSLSFQIF